MKVLVIKNDGIGDLVLVSGLLSEMAEHFGSVDLLTCIENQEIAENIEGVKSIYYVSRDGIQISSKLIKFGIYHPHIPTEDQKVISRINQVGYNIVICLRRYIRQSSLVLLNEIRADRSLACWVWSTNIDRRYAIRLSASVEWHIGDLSAHSELDYFRSWFASVFGVVARSSPKLLFKYAENHVVDNKLIGICLSGWFKNWSEAKWLEISNMLLSHGYRICLFGGDDAKAKGDRIAALSDKVTNLVGKLNFKDSIPYVASCCMIISNDTGFAHYASIYAEKVLVILGGGTFDHFLPWPENKNQFVIFNGLECFGCNWKCRYQEMRCFTELKVDSVFNYFEAIQSGTAEMVRNVGSNVPQIGQKLQICQTNRG